MNRLKAISALIVSVLFTAGYAAAQEEYVFDEKELEQETKKKPYHIGGYVEFTPSLYVADRESALYRLKYPLKKNRRFFGEGNLGLQLDGILEWEAIRLAAKVDSFVEYSAEGWNYDITLYEGYLSVRPDPMIIFNIGKKSFQWGKGYAWNPVAFIDRPKNPDDPELSLEGYTAASMDLIFSLNSPLKTVAFSAVLLPVCRHINEDFGPSWFSNFAGKVYFLFFGADIDFTVFTGRSRTTRFGVDFSKNLTPDLELHGEFSYIHGFKKYYIDTAGNLFRASYPKNYLAGVRYLTFWDMTIILEYFRNESGYDRGEMEDYYSFMKYSREIFKTSGNVLPLRISSIITKGGYGNINVMQNYLYLRISQKEPFDILYVTPSITCMLNIDDMSCTITPELLYMPVTNLELRLKSGFLVGMHSTEFGEKFNDYVIEARVKYYF